MVFGILLEKRKSRKIEYSFVLKGLGAHGWQGFPPKFWEDLMVVWPKFWEDLMVVWPKFWEDLMVVWIIIYESFGKILW